jgi:hypothetical protein
LGQTSAYFKVLFFTPVPSAKNNSYLRQLDSRIRRDKRGARHLDDSEYLALCFACHPAVRKTELNWGRQNLKSQEYQDQTAKKSSDFGKKTARCR